jgi:hypothetical protein
VRGAAHRSVVKDQWSFAAAVSTLNLLPHGGDLLDMKSAFSQDRLAVGKAWCCRQAKHS